MDRYPYPLGFVGLGATASLWAQVTFSGESEGRAGAGDAGVVAVRLGSLQLSELHPSTVPASDGHRLEWSG
ncbi:MAG: hypothetical protein ACKVIQ_05335 [Acidimicrobiales bacterium]